MAKIKGATTGQELEVDLNSKAARATLYDSSGNEKGTTAYPLIAKIKGGVSGAELDIDSTSKAARITPYNSAGVEQGTPTNPLQITVKSGATTDALTVDPTSKALRATLYDSDGHEKNDSDPLPIIEKTGRGTFVGDYACSTWRTLGIAATPQNLASIENPAASGKNLAVKAIILKSDSTALLATVSPYGVLSRPTALPTGGSVIPADKIKSTYASAVAVVRAGTASDGGAVTAITATAGSRINTEYIGRQTTAVGWITFLPLRLWPMDDGGSGVVYVLAPGEALLIQIVTAAAATTHFIVNFFWEEYTP